MAKKVYVFTGGGSGLALASARMMVEEGTILLAELRAEALERVKPQFIEMGADVHTFECDVTKADSVKALADYATSLGDVYAVVHCAGASPANSPADLVFKVNGTGSVNMVKVFYTVLKDGVMILFSSKASYIFDTNPKMAPLVPAINDLFYKHWNDSDFVDQMESFAKNVMQVPEAHLAGSAYTIVKYFVRHFVKMNVKRFADKGCRIISVSPGSFLTPMHQALIDNAPETADFDMASIPMKRWGHPYEMAALIKFLCSKGAGYITGVDILPDGGGTLTAGIPQIE